MKFIWVVIFVFSLQFNILAKENLLKIYYYERPPYYYTNSNGEAVGIINEIVKKILKDANIKYNFESIPIKRIFLLLEKDDYACSPGWFKTPERLRKFKYTLPIFKSKKGVAIFNKDVKVPENISLKYLFKSKYKLGLISGFNYGPIIEDFLKRYQPKYLRITTSQDNLIKMVAVHRIDYTFFSLENVERFIKKFPTYGKKLKIVNVLEIKEGIKRYIICSKKVDDKIIKKINNSIKKLKILK